jgi:hypothetical protein
MTRSVRPVLIEPTRLCRRITTVSFVRSGETKCKGGKLAKVLLQRAHQGFPQRLFSWLCRPAVFTMDLSIVPLSDSLGHENADPITHSAVGTPYA